MLYGQKTERSQRERNLSGQVGERVQLKYKPEEKNSSII